MQGKSMPPFHSSGAGCNLIGHRRERAPGRILNGRMRFPSRQFLCFPLTMYTDATGKKTSKTSP
jgi:hypothetical protein